MMREPFQVDVDFMGAACIGFKQRTYEHTTLDKILETVAAILTRLEPFVP
jgi:hypothetical protein